MKVTHATKIEQQLSQVNNKFLNSFEHPFTLRLVVSNQPSSLPSILSIFSSHELSVLAMSYLPNKKKSRANIKIEFRCDKNKAMELAQNLDQLEYVKESSF